MIPINKLHASDLRNLRAAVIAYLGDLQGGKIGTPTIESLQNAGILHQWLEDLGEVQPPKK
jgi:hypothetical protein